VRRLRISIALPLLLCGVLLALWIASYRRAFTYGFYADKDATGFYRDYDIVSDSGQISYTWFWQYSPTYPTRGVFIYRSFDPEPDRWPWWWKKNDMGFSFAGFYYENTASPSRLGWHTIAVPYWFLIFILMIIPALRYWRRRARMSGLCRKCGYDLRATPARCPECGTAAETA